MGAMPIYALNWQPIPQSVRGTDSRMGSFADYVVSIPLNSQTRVLNNAILDRYHRCSFWNGSCHCAASRIVRGVPIPRRSERRDSQGGGQFTSRQRQTYLYFHRRPQQQIGRHLDQHNRRTTGKAAGSFLHCLPPVCCDDIAGTTWHLLVIVAGPSGCVPGF